MPISRYPRPGHRLAPRCLASALDVAARFDGEQHPPEPKLSDLDEACWEKYDAATCEQLSQQVVEAVRGRMRSLASGSVSVALPKLPKGIGLDDLELEARTRNCLAASGLEDAAAALSNRTLREVAGMKGMGARCLVDLLTSLESFDARIVNKPWYSDERLADVVDYEVTALRETACSRLILANDPRFGRLISRLMRIANVPSDVLDLNGILEQISHIDGRRKNSVEIVTVVHQIRELIDRASGLKLEEELFDVIPREETARNRKLFWLRHGWDGESRRTLQQLADEFDLTRERVRQICDHLEAVLASTQPYAPCLDRALEHIDERKPFPADTLVNELWEQELTDCHFSLSSLLDAAVCLNRPCSLVVKHIGDIEMVLDAEDAELTEVILQESREAVRHWGVANVDYVGTLARRRLNRQVKRRLVAQTVRVAEGFEWLDMSGGWFWLSTVNPNRLVNQIRKITSVARVVSVHDLRTGISRHQRMKGLAPPDRILLKLCASLGHIVDGDMIIAPEALDWRDTLGWAEQRMVEALQASHGICGRGELEGICRDRGMKASTLQAYLDYSPLVVKLEDGRYCLRGVQRPTQQDTK